jgi:hypothetical protein
MTRGVWTMSGKNVLLHLTRRVGLGTGLVLLAFDALHAQVDFSGVWANIRHEDNEPRDPLPGEYVGLPLSEAARQRADTWSASSMTLPEWQCRPHPIFYMPRGIQPLMIDKVINPVTRELVALQLQGSESVITPIFLDGRPHPSDLALHTWAGFSTGEWIGNTLKITTTHLKDSYLRRNGVHLSDETTMTQYWMRRGDILTWVQIHYDPINLTEPYIRVSEYRYQRDGHLDADECIVADEIPRERGEVPHYFPGENDALRIYSEQFEIPYEATRGDAQTMYPEYREALRELGGVRIPSQEFQP